MSVEQAPVVSGWTQPFRVGANTKARGAGKSALAPEFGLPIARGFSETCTEPAGADRESCHDCSEADRFHCSDYLQPAEFIEIDPRVAGIESAGCSL